MGSRFPAKNGGKGFLGKYRHTFWVWVWSCFLTFEESGPPRSLSHFSWCAKHHCSLQSVVRYSMAVIFCQAFGFSLSYTIFFGSIAAIRDSSIIRQTPRVQNFLLVINTGTITGRQGAILLQIVLHKFTNPKFRNQCCNVFDHVVRSVLLHSPYILLETTSIFTLGFSSLILWNLIFHWWHKEKMCFLKPLFVLRTVWHSKVFVIMLHEYNFEMKHFAGL